MLVPVGRSVCGWWVGWVFCDWLIDVNELEGASRKWCFGYNKPLFLQRRNIAVNIET